MASDTDSRLPEGHPRKVVTREKVWSDECEDVDKAMRAPQPVYEFSGRAFKEDPGTGEIR